MVQTKSQKAEISKIVRTPVVSVPPFKTDFAIIDVKQGRAKLAKFIKAGHRVLLRLEIVIDQQNSSDDGTSIEFCGKVVSVRVPAKSLPNSVREAV